MEVGESKIVYETDTLTKLVVHRPYRQGKNLKNIYEIKKNFQIFIEAGPRRYTPTHLIY